MMAMMMTMMMMLQSLSHEPAIVNLLRQQYDIDVNVRSLKSFMVFRLTLLNFVHRCIDNDNLLVVVITIITNKLIIMVMVIVA